MMPAFIRQCKTLCFRSFSAIIILCAATVSVCMAQPVPAPQIAPQVKIDSIVVVVNNGVITRKELNDRITLVESKLKRQGIHPPRAELERQVLERMIVESVQLQRAKERGIQVDNRQLDAMVAMIVEQNHMTMDQFRHELESNGSSLQIFRETVRNDITRERLRDLEVTSKIEVSDSEVDHLLGITESPTGGASTATQAARHEIRLAHILIRIPENASPEQIAGRRDRAERVLQNLREGGTFEQNAATYS
ncbi:MAG: SurA N-terminal domain-containing protein, partial [Burkholderiaceae bacterium]|nr:SurA N-terminal domain-containing protein [Burkholderiaceae bacterium]